MAKHRKIEDELEARACLAAVDAAGGHIASWTRARGIDGRSLHARHLNLSRGSSSAPRRRKRRALHESVTPFGRGLVELVPTPGSGSSTVTSRYAVRVGAVAVEFSDDFHEETLRRVIGLLGSC